jgi:putative phosphonate metabolism protein
MTARYAIYFAPAKDSPWWRFGAGWLGRDETSNTPLTTPTAAQLDADMQQQITAEPRRYGFHATLKAPFRLRIGSTLDDLLVQLRTLADTLKPVALGPLYATALGNFVALVPVLSLTDPLKLAARCVTELDALRAPLSEAEQTRRRAAPLDTRELALLARYGYPYVLERFRLHFSLTGPVASTVSEHVLQAVAEPVARLNAYTPLVLDRLSLFVEPAPGQGFTRLTDLVLAK